MTKTILCLLAFITLAGSAPLCAQRIHSWQVKTAGTETFSIPMSVDLDAVTFEADSSLQLLETTGGRKTPVPFQVETNGGRRLYWMLEPAKQTTRNFELAKTTSAKDAATSMQTRLNDGALTVQYGSKNLLRYHSETVYPPKGIDTAYKRSGFIHPLWTPNGEELTRINAPDHYHHWGMWNPWTHVLFEKDTVDFWNLRDRKGTVRFAGFGALFNGPVYSGYEALHQHIAFKKDGTEKNALNELQTVRIYRPDDRNNNYYIMDVTVQLSCAGSSPVKLLEYRYGGLGIRATASWNKDNSIIFTSEGKDRKAADGSTARWCVAQGQLNQQYGGLEMMSFPANYNYPEPLRVWPENMNNRGDVFLNFSPTKNKDWLLEPGKQYLLRYRFLVFNNRLPKEQAEEAWQAFAHPPKITFK
ncbi:PmoA family protein [Niabella pedocola]|uniref:PmoA family protein n=1 Tax=Niabella pedocola TaxID=1752077 RepID=A0ABS8PR14_9BACT|nr:PmoA family protein [Niabella pedocola]MCD2423519.1 PmoA family protein [Niabella pedocola]